MRFKRWPRAVSAAVLLAASATSGAQVHAKNEAVIHEGLRIFYNRDRGQITGIDIQLPGQKQQRQPFMTDIKWFPFGPPKSWRWANGAEVNRTFDLSARMTSTEFATYRYDAAGRMTGITQSLWATGPGKQPHVVPVTWEVTYDSRNRITGFSREGASSQYTYDANSNRLSAVETVSGGLDLDGAFDGADVFQSTEQSVQMDPASNRMLGFTRTVTRVEGGQTRSVVTTPVAYTLDANGNITSDGLRVFEYDSARNLAKVRVSKSQEAASVRYLVNALGQRVFKSEPMAEDATPGDGTDLEKGFAAWLRQRLGWLFKPSRTEGMLGTIYNYGDGPIPVWALMGEYDTGTALGKGVTEYIWMPLDDGSAIPVGMVRNGDVFAIHTDHLGTPRLVTDGKAKPVWQWPYSAFGANQPIGMLQPAGKQNKGNTGEPPGYKATQAEEELNLRFPGQYWDEESQLVYNFNRSYRPDSGRYGQADPIGLGGGLNRYAYAQANTLGYTDPQGLNAGTVPAMSLIGPGPTGLASRGAALLGPAGVAVATGVGAYQAGTTIYPIIEPLLSSAIDLTAKACLTDCSPPAGTVCFFIDIVPSSKPHYPILGSHYHLYQHNQAQTGTCFWNYVGASATAPPGAISCPFERTKTR